jgi:hypothetical protein
MPLPGDCSIFRTPSLDMTWGLLQASRLHCAGDPCTMRRLFVGNFLVNTIVLFETAA